MQAGFGYQCGVDRYHLSHSGHARSESRLLCALFLSGGLGFGYAYGTGAVTKQRHSSKL
jgi:hypothetical protein